MSVSTSKNTFDFRSIEFRLTFLLFLLLWSYLVVRAFTVFYLHDEIVTKWSYVVHWNYLPNQGAVDANNHFLLSFLAGFFTRLFHSDSMFLMRLGSLLVFPIYFWSIYGLRNLFVQKWNFYALLLTLTTTSFLIEYFALARGYGLALAFLVFSVQQMISYFETNQKMLLIGALLGWMLAVYANLTILPLALFGLLLLLIHTVRRRFFVWIIPIVLAVVPFIYFVEYSFTLKELGKLYYGGTDGFFVNTVHSLTRYIWFAENGWMDAILTLVVAFTLFVSIRRFWNTKNLLDPKLVISIFLFVGIAGILLQHWLLDVNFPEDRTAIYLVIFFLGGFFFALDEVKVPKYVGMSLSAIAVVLFLFTANFTHSLQFNSEHIDVEMVREIPLEVKGTPPTTAGRWNMENELTRELNLPFRVYQNNDNDYDTIVDYMIYDPTRRPEILKLYEVIRMDDISGQALLKRKRLFDRTQFFENNQMIGSASEFQTLGTFEVKEPMIFRCQGELQQMTDEKEIFIVFTSEDSITKQVFTYEAVPMIRNRKVDQTGVLKFDFSYAMNAVGGANKCTVYLWNQQVDVLGGNIGVKGYRLTLQK